MKSIAKYRKPVQIMLSGLSFFILSKFSFGLAFLFGISILLGAVLGKTFCKWMCPVGLMMEFMTRGMSDDQQRMHMYNYYKVGCPISWVQGFFNKYSLFKIQRNHNTCISCGLCDKACYIATLNPSMSLYKKDKQTPATAFNCSKCMACVSACPNESLKVSK